MFESTFYTILVFRGALYSIGNRKITDYDGEVSGTSDKFRHYEKSFGVEEIYYRTENGNVVEVICEAFNENGARTAVTEFLDNLILN